jgi:amino acid transporter
VWHGLGGKLLIVALLLSTIATLETTLIQVTRTLFTMGRDKTLPAVLGTTHPTRKTPFVATMVVTVLSLGLFVASQYVGSVGNILVDGYNAIAIQICIYYSLAGISVVILYRRQLFKSVNNFIFIGLWPLLGAIFMIYLFVKSLPELNHVELIVGLGSMALGLIPMAWYWYKGAPYFKMPDKLDRHAQLLELQQMEELL